MAVIVTNRIPVNDAYKIDFEDRFKKRIGLVDSSPGFIRNEVHRPAPMHYDRASGEWAPDPAKSGYYEVKTWWRSMDDFIAWTKSESFRLAHANRPPKDMFTGPSELTFHEIVLSTDLDADIAPID
ncbi:MAG: antibiotic biosynthesis monooxygenase family protein [Bradymonadia bacterium]